MILKKYPQLPTDQKIKALKPKDKPYKITDEKGMHLLIKSNGGVIAQT